jgi:hypothetical protein
MPSRLKGGSCKAEAHLRWDLTSVPSPSLMFSFGNADFQPCFALLGLVEDAAAAACPVQAWQGGGRLARELNLLLHVV